MSNICIQDLSSNHHYRTELPNIIYEIGLDSNEIALYSAIKRSAGDSGACTRSNLKLSKMAGMSPRTLQRTLPRLQEVNKILGKPLIVRSERINENGDQDTNLITIIDIWPENYAFFKETNTGVKLSPPHVKLSRGHAKMTGPRVSDCHDPGVKLAHKEEPVKKNLYEEERRKVVVDFFDCLKLDERLNDQQKKDLMSFPEERVSAALKYSQEVTPTKTLIAQLIWHCSQKTPPVNVIKKNFKQEVRERFKHGEVYNGAICWHSEDAIAFERGLKNLQINNKEADYENKFKKILAEFKIKY